MWATRWTVRPSPRRSTRSSCTRRPRSWRRRPCRSSGSAWTRRPSPTRPRRPRTSARRRSRSTAPTRRATAGSDQGPLSPPFAGSGRAPGRGPQTAAAGRGSDSTRRRCASGWDAPPVSEPTVAPILPEPTGFAGPGELAAALEATGYLPDEGLATAAYLALVMHRPLCPEGEAGVIKTALAYALAGVTGRPIYRLQCYEGLEASQALYEWDFGRQLLHLRAAEAAHATADTEKLEASLYDRRFLLARPLLQALEDSPSVLLVDEVDRADDEFEAFLLEVLSDFTISIPELGTITAKTPPLVVLTSNRTREVHDALKRRCLYHWLEHPDFDREVAILRRRLPDVTESLARQVARATG